MVNGHYLRKAFSKLTPAAIIDLNLVCRSSSMTDSILSRVGSNRIPIYQSDRRYGERTANIRRITAGSLVTKSLGPILARDPKDFVNALSISCRDAYSNIPYF